MILKKKPVNLGRPNRIITKTRGIAKKEAFFLKSGRDIKHISKIREKNNVVPDLKKYKRFEKKHAGKNLLRIHTHLIDKKSNKIPVLSTKDIISNYLTSYLSENNYNSDISSKSINRPKLKDIKPEVISMFLDKKEIGRIHFHLTQKTVNILENYIFEKNYPKSIKDLNENKKRIISEIGKKMKIYRRRKILNSDYFKELKTSEQLDNFALRTTIDFYKDILGLNIRIVALPGYKFNKATMSFERI